MKPLKRSRYQINNDISSESSGESSVKSATGPDGRDSLSNTSEQSTTQAEPEGTEIVHELPSTSSEIALTSRSMLFPESTELDRDLRAIVAKVIDQDRIVASVTEQVACGQKTPTGSYSGNETLPQNKKSRADQQLSTVGGRYTDESMKNHYFDPDELKTLAEMKAYRDEPPSPES